MTHRVHAPLALIDPRQLQLIFSAYCPYRQLKPSVSEACLKHSNRARSFPTAVGGRPSGTPLLRGLINPHTPRSPVSRTPRPQSVLNLGLFSKAGCRVEDVDESKCWPGVKDGICQSRIAGVYKMVMFSTHFKTSSHGGRYGFKRGL